MMNLQKYALGKIADLDAGCGQRLAEFQEPRRVGVVVHAVQGRQAARSGEPGR